MTGTIVTGMTVTGTGVAKGVTITSFGTGAGGAGTYNCSSSASNVTAAEAMVFSLSWNMPLQGNASFTQNSREYGIQWGYGKSLWISVQGPAATPGAQYTHGTHREAIYNAEALKGTRTFKTVFGKQGRSIPATIITAPQPPPHIAPLFIHTAAKTSEAAYQQLSTIIAAPQYVDFTLQADFTASAIAQTYGFSAQFTYGTHAVALYNSQIQSQVWGPLIPPVVSSALAPLKTILVPPQAFDFSLKASLSNVPVTQGWISTQISAGPQLLDLTQSAVFSKSSQFSTPPLPVTPKTIIAARQEDPTQIQPVTFKPPLKVPPKVQLPFVSAFPTPWDPTVIQGQLTAPRPLQPANYLQPSCVTAGEQKYENIQGFISGWATFTFNPPPPIIIPFRVMAVTAGYYNNVFRTPGDVFDLLSPNDFSDASIDYQLTGEVIYPEGLSRGSPGGLLGEGGQLLESDTNPGSSGTIGFGWMVKVASNTPLFDWLSYNNAPYLPPQDPNRRFIY